MNKLLLIDDEPEILEMLSEMLKSEFQVATAQTVKEAKLILMSEEINAVISDIDMPDESGLELVKFMSVKFPLIPSALLTGNPSRDYTLKAVHFGASNFLDKPFAASQVMRAARNLIEVNKRNLLEDAALSSHPESVKIKTMQYMKRMFRVA